MASTTTASNLTYDLVAIQYHALKGAQVYDRYLDDAAGDEESAAFIQEVKDQDNRRAVRAHELLTRVAGDGIG